MSREKSHQLRFRLKHVTVTHVRRLHTRETSQDFPMLNNLLFENIYLFGFG